MSKIARKAQKIFGNSGTTSQFGVFGSLAAGTPDTSKDPDSIQSLSNFLDGWYQAVVGNNSPAIEDMNSLCFLFAYQLAYIFQSGIPEWNSATTYYTGSLCSGVGDGKIYTSLVDDNTNNALSDSTKWKLIDVTQNISYIIKNLTISASVATNAMTIAVKTQAGSNASNTDPIYVGFRSSTLSSGSFNVRSILASLSITIPSGQSMGQANGVQAPIFVYLIDNAGTPELAVSGSYYPEDSLVSTSAVSGASTSTGIYSTTARSSVPLRLVAIMQNTQATAGTWATAPSQIQLKPDQSQIPNNVVSTTTTATCTSNSRTYLCDATGGAYTQTLMSAVGLKGYRYTIKKTDSSANKVTVGTTSSQTIDGSTTFVLAFQYQAVTVESDGSNWQVVA